MIKRLRTWAALLPLALTIAVAGSVLQGQGPSTPILLVTNSGGTNPFQGFLAEILKAEGIPSFTSQQVSALNASTLSGTRLVLLGETTLSPVQATLLRDYVNQGGRLIAMRPADQIADLFGLVPQGTSTLNGYMLINQADAAGAGLSTVTLPIRGTASHFSVTGAAATVATLYSDRSTPTTYPAVVRNNRTVAWAFDLARSVVYARQGDPANINVDTGLVPPLQSFDMFYTGFDAQRIAVPYADIQMRLLARQIADLLADDQPLPRLWYYPSARRAMMILGADAHHNPNNAFDQMMASAESFGGRVTFFVARYMPEPTPAQAANWRARGHEITTHPYGSNDGVSLQQGFQFATDWFASAGLGAPSRTVRSHQIEWLGWVDAAQIAANFGGGLDLNHYSFGPAVLQPNGRQGQGYITGSGRPMRFVNTNGTLVQPAIYGQPTVLIDHQLFGITIWSDTLSTADALGVSRTLIDAAVTDYHTVIPTQWHVDYYTWGEVQPWVDGTMEYAQANNVPMWTGERWLRYTEARDATLISGTTWSSTLRQLQFTVTVPTGAEAQTVMVPTLYAGNQLVDVRVNGTVTAVTTQLLNGRSESMFSVAPSSGGASVIVTYGTATPSLTINDVSVVEGTASQNTAVFTVTLSPASSSQVTVNFAAASGTATAPADFGAGSGTLTFAPTVTTRTISVPIVNDA
ncbi:MAG: Calx-beta domain-containing protein, partial [Vicinamibacterales bacterium]